MRINRSPQTASCQTDQEKDHHVHGINRSPQTASCQTYMVLKAMREGINRSPQTASCQTHDGRRRERQRVSTAVLRLRHVRRKALCDNRKSSVSTAVLRLRHVRPTTSQKAPAMPYQPQSSDCVMSDSSPRTPLSTLYFRLVFHRVWIFLIDIFFNVRLDLLLLIISNSYLFHRVQMVFTTLWSTGTPATDGQTKEMFSMKKSISNIRNNPTGTK